VLWGAMRFSEFRVPGPQEVPSSPQGLSQASCTLEFPFQAFSCFALWPPVRSEPSVVQGEVGWEQD
jgi:hypothetical protein